MGSRLLLRHADHRYKRQIQTTIKRTNPFAEIVLITDENFIIEVLLIDKNRKVSWYHQGFVPGDEKEIEAQILRLLDSYSILESKK